LGINQKKQRHGFSLLELMIVIMIIGLLAAVAVPIFNRNVYTAKKAEGYAMLGSIRSQLYIYYGEWGDYPIVNKKDYVIGASWNDIKPGELSGVYFSDSSFYYKCRDGVKYEIIASKKTTFLEKDLKLKHDGTFKD